MATKNETPSSASKKSQAGRAGNARKIFLLTLIASLSISALIAITIFMSGEFGDTQGKVLFTTLAIGVYSLTGLCCTSLYDRQRYVVPASLGIIASVAAFIIALLSIWGDQFIEANWRLLLTSLVVAVSLAHVSLLLLIETAKRSTQYVRALTFGCIAVVAGLLIYLIYGGSDGDSNVLIRLIGTFAVLDVLGTILTPLLRKIES